jgi:predicted ATPase/class 3 adenylate cyclase
VGLLPSGTVTMLFSDIEGSTVLLSRLGDAYADVLDGQRRVLRKAWAEHGGTEMGTEGDSFFVVFPTAQGAVAAAAQAQRELADYPWPSGERMRVRMGIHTGSPALIDGAYIGMDVHRAARIAASAHGGQVVVSQTTANLAGSSSLAGFTFRDLGLHQLKDLPEPERILQLVIDALSADFPPLRSLGTTSSLPRPPSSLLGRDGELAELVAMMSSPGVRLVTLTGSGGSGKTRLAIALAERLVDSFPDGVYFVPLASVTTGDVMWTSISEVLNVPPEGRIPPGFFEHVAYRTALFLLDNLEQIEAADAVVAELLNHGPQVVVIATSRRPLHIGSEHEHPVPPLELPVGCTLEQIQRSGAVQLFVQQVCRVRPSFVLSQANAGAVVDLCRRLDGLPLALELAAARCKVLSPSALLTRMDKALDLTAAGSLTSARQKTLRDTIAWSNDLLDARQQSFFRRLGVFAGGAGLEAVGVVAEDVLQGDDPLDFVAGLVDVSLVTVTEDHTGEPRVGLLETIRAFALEQLHRLAELDAVRRDHAQYFQKLVAPLERTMSGGTEEQRLIARGWFEIEHDNLREALTWTVAAHDECPDPARVKLGMLLCRGLTRLWIDGGYFAEARSWLEQVLAASDGQQTSETAFCLCCLGSIRRLEGEYEDAAEILTRAVALARRMSPARDIAIALWVLGWCERDLERAQSAQAAFEEALAVARKSHELDLEIHNLTALGVVYSDRSDHRHAVQLHQEALDLAVKSGDDYTTLLTRVYMASSLSGMGDLGNSHRAFHESLPALLRIGDQEALADTAESYAGLLAAMGKEDHAVRILGSADAFRERINMPRPPHDGAQLREKLAICRTTLGAHAWETAYQSGRNLNLEETLRQADAATYQPSAAEPSASPQFH